MKKNQLVFRRLTVKETAKITGGQTPAYGYCSNQTPAVGYCRTRVPGGDLTVSVEANYPVGDLWECNPAV